MDKNELIDKITKEVLQRLNEKTSNPATGEQPNTQSQSSANRMSQAELAGYIDHTLLKPEAVESQFEQLCNEAVVYKFKSVCYGHAGDGNLHVRIRKEGSGQHARATVVRA